MIEYNASNIKRTKGAEKIRGQVARYLGSSDIRGILNQFTEIYDNALDEVLEYHALLSKKYPDIVVPPLQIYVTITPTDEVIIEDEGRGLPCDIHPETNEPAIYLIFEDDSAGGKGNHSQGGYETATSGMHGAGACVSKACTDFFNVEARNNGVYYLQYRKGEREQSLIKTGELVPHRCTELASLGVMYTGTKITYKFDNEVLTPTLEGTEVEPYSYDSIKNKIVTTITGLSNPDSVRIILNYKNNIEEINPNDYTPEKLLGVNNEDIFTIDLKSSYKQPYEKDYFEGTLFVARNNKSQNIVILNRLGLNSGSIDKAFNNAFLTELKNMVGVSSSNYKHFISEEIEKYSFIGIMRLTKPEFSGQSKQYLSSNSFIPEMKNQIKMSLWSPKVQSYLQPYISNIKNQIAQLQQQQLEYQKIQQQQQAYNFVVQQQLKEKQQAIYDENVEKNKSTLEKIQDLLELDKSNIVYFSSKYPKDRCSLVIVEGVSAATQVAPEVKDQAIEIFGIKGKPTNVFKQEKLSKDSSMVKLLRLVSANNYRNIKILVDADSDGLHMRLLLLSVFWKYNPDIIKNGKLFMVKSPYAKFRNNTGIPININKTVVQPNSFYYPIDGNENEEAKQMGLTFMTKYTGLADSISDSNLKILDLLTKNEFIEQIPHFTPDDVQILEDILSTESALKRIFISNLSTERRKKTALIKYKINKIERFRANFNFNYNAQPTVQDYRVNL